MVSAYFKDKSPPNIAQPACSEQLLEIASQLP